MAISNLVQAGTPVGLNPTQRQRLRGLGAVQAAARDNKGLVYNSSPSKLTVGSGALGGLGGAPDYSKFQGGQYSIPSISSPGAPVTHAGVNGLSETQRQQLRAQGGGGSPTPAPAPQPTAQAQYSPQPAAAAYSAPQQQQAGPRGLFPSIVSSLAARSSQPTDVYNQGAAGLLGSTATNPLQTGDAAQGYQNAVKGLADFRTSVADTRQNIYDAPTSARVMQGRDAAIQQANAAKEAALQSAVTQAQQGIQYGIQEQQTQQAGYGAAAGAANTQQGIQQSGLGTAAGYAAPQLGGIGQVPFNPVEQNQGQILGTAQPGGVQAAGNLLGQFSGAQAVGAAPGQAQASNIGTQQTAQVNALAQVYGQNAPQAYALNNSLNNIESLGSLTLQTLQGNNINPLTFPAGNSTIAEFKRQLGSAGQAAFDSNMANFQSALTAIYADTSGAIPTQVTQWGTQIANGSMPLKQLQAIYSQAINEGNIRLGNLKNTVGSAYSGLQGSPTTGGNQTTGGVIQTPYGAINPAL